MEQGYAHDANEEITTEINRLVYKLYGLSDIDVDIIEGQTAVDGGEDVSVDFEDVLLED